VNDGSVSPAELIKRNVSLSSFASKFTDSLHPDKTGTFRSKCFVHGGENPNSMIIDDNDGRWYCFSCGEGGDIFTMYMAMNDGKEFLDALEDLATSNGIDLPSMDDYRIGRRRIVAFNDVVADFCTDYLLDSKNKDAKAVRRELFRQGFTEEIIEDWRIGFLPSGSRGYGLVEDAAIEVEDKKPKALYEATNLMGYQHSGRRWSMFTGRLMFPIIDERGDVIAFSARVLDGIDTEFPDRKYVNSPDSSAYNKSSVLYGMQNLITAKEASKHPLDHIVICEGQKDTIAVDEVIGSNQVMAMSACGTAFGNGHISLLTRAKKVTFMFDGDAAGQKALTRSLWTLNHLKDATVRAVILDDDVDPWDLYADERDKELRLQIKQSMDMIEAVVSAQWNLLEGKRHEMTLWVKNAAMTLSYSDDREHLIREAARIMGQTVTAFKKNLSLPSRLVDDKRHENAQSTLSPITKSVVSMLLCLDRKEMDSILAPLFQWTDINRRAVENWLPSTTPADIDAYHRLASGYDANVDPEIDRAILMLYPKEPGEKPDSIKTILTGMAHSLRGNIGSITTQENSARLAQHVTNLRKCISICHIPEAQPYVLAYLIDCANDIEIVTEALEAA